MFKRKFPFFKQHDAMDCGPTCIRMIAAHYGRSYSLQYLRENSYIDREGVSVRGIVEAAEHIGFQTIAAMIPYKGDGEEIPGLVEAPLPCIVHWRQKHFVIVYRMSKKHLWIADPATGRLKLTIKEFKKNWLSNKDKGTVVLLETTPQFYVEESQKINKTGFGFLFRYLRPYRNLVIQLIIGLLIGSLFQLIFPFLTQAIVDTGIQNQDIDFIWLILAAQLMLFMSQTSVDIIRGWILLHISTRINVSLIADFLTKLMRLPIGFFDAKLTGDLLQRIGDHRRIETFLTNSTLNIIFSFFNILVFLLVLLFYNFKIFAIFLIASVLYILWITLWLGRRAKVDYLTFEQKAENQSALIELIQGMQEIKLQNSERKRRWQWMNIQAKLFRANIKSLTITQYQDVGAGIINQLKDILITFFAATAVIRGEMTLGMMLAVQYIIGQLNAPLVQMIQFIRNAQDARISLERLGEIHNQDNEEQENRGIDIDMIPKEGDIYIKEVSFQYNKLSDMVLKNINLSIPKGKVTAIVGTSGSGKTTLVKLLLGFYVPTQGSIKVGGMHLNNISKRVWRNQCGAVMQDGFIFSDSMANNIAESEDIVDKNKLLRAVKTANIQDFIEKNAFRLQY